MCWTPTAAPPRSSTRWSLQNHRACGGHPNGDGKNDVFTVPGLKEAYPDAKITIYDRWGKKLADYKASDGDWDGTYNGHQMPSTDYWYEISVDEIDKTYTGHFTLLRSK